MGKLSGVNTSLITKISGVPVSSITKVGPTLASSIGLGSGGGTGGYVLTIDFFDDPGQACSSGPDSISRGSQTLYYDERSRTFYTDSGFTSPFRGSNGYYYDQTNNKSWQIDGGGVVMDQVPC